jgi:hypothetical protein
MFEALLAFYFIQTRPNTTALTNCGLRQAFIKYSGGNESNNKIWIS